jgi:hypothetical protein
MDLFSWLYKDKGTQKYLVNYALIDLRTQLASDSDKDEMWLAEVVSDAMTT